MRIFNILLLLFVISVSATSQMEVNNDTLVGNEWIDYSKTYFKIKLAEDGLYKV
ncbi:MAG TPA: hypothetical protein PK147_01185 [Saprospiraceae bacterium]|nr:hypothetical protein [Saprospiraceae bacterium]